MTVLPIEALPHLAKRLGASGMDRIRYAGKANHGKAPGSTNIPNTILTAMQYVHPNEPGYVVNDLITGAAYMDCYQTKPLNINRLYNILQCIRMINTREIMVMTGLKQRQSQKYLRAIKVVLPFLESHFSV